MTDRIFSSVTENRRRSNKGFLKSTELMKFGWKYRKRDE
ncbi:hypothetical protein ACVWYG_003451 [Pedobacter sp. UYEF25]